MQSNQIQNNVLCGVSLYVLCCISFELIKSVHLNKSSFKNTLPKMISPHFILDTLLSDLFILYMINHNNSSLVFLNKLKKTNNALNYIKLFMLRISKITYTTTTATAKSKKEYKYQDCQCPIRIPFHVQIMQSSKKSIMRIQLLSKQ